MPRQTTRGLAYTFLDKDFFTDRKVKKLRRKCGDDSPYVFLALLCLIAPEGYYIKYDNDTVFDLTDMTGFEEDRIKEILSACGEVGLLDGYLMTVERVLTSHGIQKYYANTCANLKRKAKVEEYSLLDNPVGEDSSEETPNISPNLGIIRNNSEVMHTKEKNRKEKNRKEFYYSLEEEKEEIISYCFFKNWAAPSKEYAKIVAYNNTGGRSWDSMTRQQKESALALWKQQPEQRPRVSPQFLSFWENMYTNLRSLNAPYEVRMDALSDSISDTIRGNSLCLHCTDRLRLYIERHLDVFKPIIRAYQSRFGLTELNYSITNNDYPDGKGLAQDPDAPS